MNTLAAALAEEPDAIEEIYEPFLIQIGFLNRTPRGRVATQLAYDHFGITPTESKAPCSSRQYRSSVFRSKSRVLLNAEDWRLTTDFL